MDCYIVIVTYNGMKWIKDCLRSIPSVYRIVVVDNNSTDGTVEFIKAHFPKVHLLDLDDNLGFGQANNKGISYALQQDAQSVFLLNQDAYIVDNALKKLLETQKKHPEYGILSPIHINAEKNKLDGNFSKYIAPPNNYNFYSDFVLRQKLEKIYPVPFVNAAAWLLSKECIEKVGGFDPLFYHYGEDENYCQRVLFHGFKTGVVPGAFVIHDRGSRISKNIGQYSSAKLNQIKLWYKVNAGNINNGNGLNLLYKRIITLPLLILLTFLQFKTKLALFKLKEFFGLLVLLKKVRQSRRGNLKRRDYFHEKEAR